MIYDTYKGEIVITHPKKKKKCMLEKCTIQLVIHIFTVEELM